ncbi:hypothetical protein E3N88_14502 [Mikania micrantha]|uniref:Uncharacterized protein n=1 Tax=Mikania micrantha TaxID=192012 RepID=A0A5N6P1W5_9ASTR|nr:hypothetical protein E3N88_14502 [Mikania micrantha]
MEVSCDHQKFLSMSSARFIAQNLESNTQILYTINNQHNQHQCRINELHGRRIRACFHGWVILSNHPDNVLWSLWNPITSKLIRLPPLIRKQKEYYECCLSSPPDDQASVFFLISDKIPTIVFCRIDRKRKRLKWIEMSYAKQLRSITGVDDEHYGYLYHPTCCNGKVYAITWMPCVLLILVDIVVKGKEVVINLSPFVEAPYVACNVSCYPFLQGSCTDLFCILLDFKDEKVKTVGGMHSFKLDMTSMMWKEMVDDDLQDAIIFLHFADHEYYSTCYYSSRVGSELGGYIHVLCESTKTMYSFSVKDRTLSLSSMSYLVRESQASVCAMLDYWGLEVDCAASVQEVEDGNTDEKAGRPIEGDDTTSVSSYSTTHESHLLNLPLHIVEMIMEHCVGVEYLRFRATCRHCYLAAPSIQWGSKTSRLLGYSLISPWLMVFDSHRGTMTFIDPVCSERYFVKAPQELIEDGYRIYCSRYGWLLMCRMKVGPRTVFFNPFTSKIRELPVVRYLESFCFSAPPTSPDCIVVGFTTDEPYHVYIHFVSQESEWREYSLNFCDFDPYSYRFPAFSGRDIYALGKNERIEAFRGISEDDFDSWEILTDVGPTSRCKSPAQYFLSNCDQHLLLVIVGEFGESVEVFKLNESAQEWLKIDGLGTHMVYISTTSCVCLDAISPEMGNKIYFPRLFDDQIVFYSLETRGYHTFDDKNTRQSFGVDLVGTKHHCYTHTWIEPNWS